MAELILFTPNRVFDINGDPVSGALAYFYAAGTTDPLEVYQDASMSIPHASPVQANGMGVFPLVYANAEASVTVTDAAGVVLSGYPMELAASVPAGDSAASGVSFAPTAEIPETDVQAAIERVQANIVEPLADFGLGVTGDATLIANIDATDTASGVYRFSNATTGTFPTGYTVTSGAVEMWRQSSTIAWQWLYTGGLTYLRRLNTTWEAWREVATVPAGSARGDMIYRGATVWARIAAGAAGQVLRMGADDPAWGGDAPGVGQTWQTPARSSGTTYTNSTGRSIMVAITIGLTGNVQASVNGTTWVTVGEASGSDADRRNTVSMIVPPGHRYRATSTVYHWAELR